MKNWVKTDNTDNPDNCDNPDNTDNTYLRVIINVINHYLSYHCYHSYFTSYGMNLNTPHAHVPGWNSKDKKGFIGFRIRCLFCGLYPESNASFGWYW